MKSHAMNLPPARKRWLIVLFLVLVPCIVLNYMSTPDMQEEILLQNSIAELQVKLEHLHAKYQVSQEEIQLLTYQLIQLTDITHLLPDNPIFNNSNYNVTNVKLPTAFNFLPYLLNDPNALRPAFIHSKGRSGVSIVLGIPTVKRQVQNYLMATLKNLFDQMNDKEIADTLIVVFVAETDLDYVNYVAKQIEVQFPNEFESGVIEIISPQSSFYPNFTKLPITLGDNHERVVWRSKQNLDFAYLMSYAQTKGTFYVQLEDDVLAKKNFITTMKSFALQKVSSKYTWYILDFCELGFIGKLFKSVDLPWFVQYFIMFYNDKPIDWLFDNFLFTKVCTPTMDNKRCRMAKNAVFVHHKPSLFQHVGTHSSLKGKVQKLKDKEFGKVPPYFPHVNPEADVSSQIKAYKQHTFKNAYNGDTFFWGFSLKPGNHLTIKFRHPIFIKSYLFRSGNAEHPSDKFDNTTVEVLPVSSNFINKNHNVTEDGYVIIGKFDYLGIAQGTVDKNLGKIAVIRLTVHSESNNWAILSEVFIEKDLSS